MRAYCSYTDQGHWTKGQGSAAPVHFRPVGPPSYPEKTVLETLLSLLKVFANTQQIEGFVLRDSLHILVTSMHIYTIKARASTWATAGV